MTGLAVPLRRVMVRVARGAAPTGDERNRRRMTLRAGNLRVGAVRERELAHGIGNPHRHRDVLSDPVGLGRPATPMTRGAAGGGALGSVMTILAITQGADRERAVRALARMTALAFERAMLRV